MYYIGLDVHKTYTFKQCAQNSPDRGPADVTRVFIEVSYDGLRQGSANIDGALRDPTI